MNISAVVVGDEHFNTLGIIRSLGESGIRPEAVIIKAHTAHSWVLSSKYVSAGKIIRRSEDEIMSALKDFAGTPDRKKYLIPTSDFAVKVLDMNHDILADTYILPCLQNKDFGLSECMDKGFMVREVEKGGFLVPVSEAVHITADMKDEASIPESLGRVFPLIIKPIDSFGSKDKITIVKSKDEWTEKIGEYIGDTVLIQQFIEKDEELGIQGVGFGGEKEPYVPGVVHKIRTSITAMGSTTYAELTSSNDAELVEKVKNLMKGISYCGIFDVEVMRIADKYYFIECNFRNGAYGYAYTRMGANLPFTWINGENSAGPLKKRMRLINAFSDIKHIGAHNVSVVKWAKQFLTSDVYLTACANDPKPFVTRLLRR